MQRTEKAQAIERIKERFTSMSSAVFVDYTGMTVEEVSGLRDALRKKGVEYRVIKNKLVQCALKDTPFVDALGKVALKGMTAVAWSFEEPSAAARVLKEYRRDNEKLKIKAGLLDGQVLNSAAVENQLATLPSKDEVRAMFLATLMAPAQSLVRVLAAPAREFVGVLAAKQRKNENGNEGG
jgi:large subunit ribosomal protein L10